MVERHQARLGAVQQTLFLTLSGRAHEARKRRPILRDPKAVEMVESIDFDESLYGKDTGAFVTVLRTAIFDEWVRAFLAEHPDGTVVEIGTGLNTRFERVDNGRVHWIDLDLPDTIELRRKFFEDTERRRMVAGSALDDSWLPEVEGSPGPYFFVSEGVLVYLPADEVGRALARLGERFPGSRVAFDTYHQSALEQQHKMAEKRGMAARWAWSCDDPRELERHGLTLTDAATLASPPPTLRRRLPFRYRALLPLANPLLRRFCDLSLFQAGQQPE